MTQKPSQFAEKCFGQLPNWQKDILDAIEKNPKVINIARFRFTKSITQRIAPSDLPAKCAEPKMNKDDFIIIDDPLNKI